MTCISLEPWVPYVICGMFTAGIAVGFCLRLVLDYAELESYRRIARQKL